MLIDRQNQFSNAQAITATANSTDYIDLSAVRNIGAGENLYLYLKVTTAFTDAGSDSTVTPSLTTDDNTAFSSVVTIRTYDTIPALAATTYERIYRLEPLTQVGIYERYIQLTYTVAGGNLTTGAISAFLLMDVNDVRFYTSASVIQ